MSACSGLVSAAFIAEAAWSARSARASTSRICALETPHSRATLATAVHALSGCSAYAASRCRRSRATSPSVQRTWVAIFQSPYNADPRSHPTQIVLALVPALGRNTLQRFRPVLGLAAALVVDGEMEADRHVHAACSTRMTVIRTPGVSNASGSSPGKTFATRWYPITRASSRQMPASVSASSVERTSFERSGFLSGYVRLRFGADAGLGIVKTMRAMTGPSMGGSPARAASAAAFTSWRHGFTFFDDST